MVASSVVKIFANNYAFAALKADGSVVTWGVSGRGGNSAAVASQLASGVVSISSTMMAFSALKSDGSVVTWGDPQNGGLSSAVSSSLASNVTTLIDDKLVPSTPSVDSYSKLSAITVSGSAVGDALNTAALSAPTTINLGSDTASVSAGLASVSLVLTGSPDAVTLGSSVSTVEYALQSSSGIETIANFDHVGNSIDIDLMGAANSVLQAHDTMLNGQHAVSLYSSADPTHGIVLVNASETAASLVANQLTFSGGHALIAAPDETVTVETPKLTAMIQFSGSDGSHPNSSLLLDAVGNLYGTTIDGGANGYGEVFQLAKSGDNYTESTLFSFNSSNGANPCGSLFADAAGNLYGQTNQYPTSNYTITNDVVFKLSNNGGVYTESTLASLNRSGGWSSLIADASGNLYGTTNEGGANGIGQVYELVKSGTGYTQSTLLSFNGANGQYSVEGLISDASGNLYGTTNRGGANNGGMVYELVKNSGTYSEIILLSFDGSNGSQPWAHLISDAAGNLYGTTLHGGANGHGTVFELVNNSSTYTQTTLFSFDGSNGDEPFGSLLADAAGNLYGTTRIGGTSGNGAVYKLVQNGGVYTETTLISFDGTNGAQPFGGLIADASGNLYGTARYGGATDNGEVFKIANSGFIVGTQTIANNTAYVSAGLSAPAMSFINTPAITTLPTATPEVISATMSPSLGVQEIANFQYSVDELVLDLNGAAANVLQAANTTVGGIAAISLYSSADPTHGIILTGMTAGQTASDLLANHTTFNNGHALIS